MSVNYPPKPYDRIQLNVISVDPALTMSVIVKYEDYDADVSKEGLLRVELKDRAAVYMWAPGQWTQMSARTVEES